MRETSETVVTSQRVLTHIYQITHIRIICIENIKSTHVNYQEIKADSLSRPALTQSVIFQWCRQASPIQSTSARTPTMIELISFSRNLFRYFPNDKIFSGETMDSEIRQNTLCHWWKLLKFFAFEIILFVTDVGTDVYSVIGYGLDNDPYWAVATTVCILLPSIPRFFSFFGEKVKMYRRDPEDAIICFFKLLFWILSFPLFLVGSTVLSNFQESISI